MAAGRPRPSFPETLADDLRRTMETGLGGVAARLAPDGGELVVRKADLARVHACETHQLSETGTPFGWNTRNARGALAHKAIELSVHLSAPPAAGELVDLALERLVEDDWEWGPGRWLSEAPAVEVAEVRAFATDVVHKFQDECPPLKRSWRPRLESSMSAPLCDGRITLRGKVDLALGQARGTEARVMIVDFKTGGASSAHVDDLRYYAVLETLRVGVPPFRVASWYLDAGHWHAEDVDEDVLFAAARRIVDGVTKLAELQVDRRPPQLSPGPTCSYCVLRAECSGAVAWTEQRAEVGLA